jgi:hypothetical protein
MSGAKEGDDLGKTAEGLVMIGSEDLPAGTPVVKGCVVGGRQGGRVSGGWGLVGDERERVLCGRAMAPTRGRMLDVPRRSPPRPASTIALLHYRATPQL